VRMKRLTRLFLLALVLTLLLAALPAAAMPLSEKASINLGMPFYLVVDMTNQYVTAYESATNTPVRNMICSTGRVRGTTPSGTFRLLSDVVDPWISFGTCYIRYGKRITGSIWFHSILYSRRGDVSSLDWTSFNKLGSPASHGCIRLTPIDAQWISYNCKKGTTVRILRAPQTADSKALAKQLKSELKAKGHKGIQPTLTPTPRPTLSVGSNNSLVKALHSRLRSLGFYTGPVNNLFTAEATKPAVEAYQAAAELTVTGEADGALQSKIARDNTVTGRLVTLQYGNNYIAVKELQRQLKLLGYLKSSFKLTTKFDAATRTAVRAFQTMAGWTPSGIATPEVQELLFGSAAPTPSPSPSPVYATTTQLTSLRKSRSTSSTRLAAIKTGMQVVVLTASDGTWTRIKYGSKTGYALSRCLTLTP
jgi:peptidoglycan hydrolase-like protein with peptidoglycan-binding domain